MGFAIYTELDHPAVVGTTAFKFHFYHPITSNYPDHLVVSFIPALSGIPPGCWNFRRHPSGGVAHFIRSTHRLPADIPTGWRDCGPCRHSFRLL